MCNPFTQFAVNKLHCLIKLLDKSQSNLRSFLSVLASVPMDVCEICAFAACTGC